MRLDSTDERAVPIEAGAQERGPVIRGDAVESRDQAVERVRVHVPLAISDAEEGAAEVIDAALVAGQLAQLRIHIQPDHEASGVVVARRLVAAILDTASRAHGR